MAAYAEYITHKNQMLGSAGQLESVRAALTGQPVYEWSGDAADAVLVEGDPVLGVLHACDSDVLRGDDRAADDVAVLAGVLRRGVGDDVGAEGDRVLQVGGREGVVDDEDRAGLVGDLGDRLDVGDAEQRVGRGLGPDHLRPAGDDRGPDRVDVADAGDRVVDPRGPATSSK